MPLFLRVLCLSLLLLGAATAADAQGRNILPPVPTPTDVKPGSITCDECPYPYPSKYLDISVYSQDVRISYMDVAPLGRANGHTVMLLHGNNFGGFYFKAIIDGLIDITMSSRNEVDVTVKYRLTCIFPYIGPDIETSDCFIQFHNVALHFF